jgi:putative iron-regulated protein
MRINTLSVALGALVACWAAPSLAAEPAAILKTYSDIALAGYEDSLTTAKALDAAVEAMVAKPSAETLDAARKAWIAARVPYQQTEAFRFGNPIVDEWEGRVNAWPLDEGLIDYVDASYGTESDENGFYTVNVIANAKVSSGGDEVDAATITPEVIQSLQEIGGVEANVATGYHAIEFLLWGQDLNGAKAGAGNRPATDFDPANCTGGNCDRRIQYLNAASDLLVADLEEMVGNWKADGAARKALVDGDPKAGLTAILTGLGSLSYGELAGERMKLGLLLHDPEGSMTASRTTPTSRISMTRSACGMSILAATRGPTAPSSRARASPTSSRTPTRRLTPKCAPSSTPPSPRWRRCGPGPMAARPMTR